MTVPAVDHFRQLIAEEDKLLRLLLESADVIEQQRIARVQDSVDHLRDYVELARAEQVKATAKSDAAAEVRFHSVNEFRQQLADQAATFVHREVADAQFADVRLQIANLTSAVNIAQGQRAGTLTTIAFMLTGSTLLIGTVSVLANILTH